MTQDLENLREDIDRINSEIVELVAERMNVVEKIKRYKKENNMSVVDEDREEEVVRDFRKMFAQKDLSPSKGEELARLLIETAVKKQQKH